MIEALIGIALMFGWAVVIVMMVLLIRGGVRIFLGVMLLTHPTHSPHAVAARAEAQRRADEIAWAYDRINR